jgi:hypothetical protein
MVADWIVSGSVMPWRERTSLYAAGTPRSEKEEMRDSDREKSGLLDRVSRTGPAGRNTRLP